MTIVKIIGIKIVMTAVALFSLTDAWIAGEVIGVAAKFDLSKTGPPGRGCQGKTAEDPGE